MNIVKHLVDVEKISKYGLAKKVGVSWNSIHFWYKEIYQPNESNFRKLNAVLLEQQKEA